MFELIRYKPSVATNIPINCATNNSLAKNSPIKYGRCISRFVQPACISILSRDKSFDKNCLP